MCVEMIAHLVILSVDERPTTSPPPCYMSATHEVYDQANNLILVIVSVVWSERSQKM